MSTRPKTKSSRKPDGEFIEIPPDTLPILMPIVRRVEEGMPGQFERQEIIDLLMNAAIWAFFRLPPAQLRRELIRIYPGADPKKIEELLRLSDRLRKKRNPRGPVKMKDAVNSAKLKTV